MRFLSQKFKTTLFIRYFGFFKVPMIFYCRPKVVSLSKKSITIKIPLNWKTKNHVGSMYLGAFSVGADITSAMLALDVIRKSKKKIIPIFKDFHAEYYMRAEGDVHFVCDEGEKIYQMLNDVQESKNRINEVIKVNAYVPSKSPNKVVAEFKLTLSMKAY